MTQLGVPVAEAPSVTARGELLDGAPRVDGRFLNHAQPSERPGLRLTAGLWARKLWTSLVPRPGAAPVVRFDRAAIENSPSLTWIGHSTFLVRMDGVTFLTDPMFSERAGPVSFAGPRRAVPPGVPLDSLPPVDFVVPLGLGEWIRGAGGDAVELDWWQEIEIAGVRVHCVPAQHFSGRSFGD